MAEHTILFQLTVYEAGYIAGLLAREGTDKGEPSLGVLSRRLAKMAYETQRRATEEANARYLGRRDDGQ